MQKFLRTFFRYRINGYFFIGALLLFFGLNYIGISFFNDLDTQDVKYNRGSRTHFFYHHK